MMDFKLVSKAEDVNFIRKGISGQWKESMSDQLIAKFDKWSAEKILGTNFPYYEQENCIPPYESTILDVPSKNFLTTLIWIKNIFEEIKGVQIIQNYYSNDWCMRCGILQH